MARGRKHMELVDVTVFYLEMFAPSHRSVPPPREGLTVVHVRSPTVPYYRSLYDAVGKDYYWRSRRKLSDEALAAILGDPRNELHVLHVEGTPAASRKSQNGTPWRRRTVRCGWWLNGQKSSGKL